MDISHITSQSLRSLLSLTEKKDELINRLEGIHAEIINVLKGGTVVEVLEVVISPQPVVITPAKTKAPSQDPKAGRSGGLKARILALLDAAGPEGLRVKEIAAQLGVSGSRISVWFSTTGKKLTTRIEPGRFAVKAMGGSQAPVVAKPIQAEVTAKPAKGKKKRKMSPEGRARISAAQKARWAAKKA
jgi:hypothetical protein